MYALLRSCYVLLVDCVWIAYAMTWAKRMPQRGFGGPQRHPKDLEVVPHPEIIIHINNDMNINIHIDINMDIDITPPPHAPPRPLGRAAPAWGWVG